MRPEGVSGLGFRRSARSTGSCGSAAGTLAADFATRSSQHDRDASHPTENYDRLRQEGFLELSVPKEFGGAGVGFLGHTLAFEALGQGCPSTALSFNMHASVVMPLLDSPEVSPQAKRQVADLVVAPATDRRQLLRGHLDGAAGRAVARHHHPSR